MRKFLTGSQKNQSPFSPKQACQKPSPIRKNTLPMTFSIKEEDSSNSDCSRYQSEEKNQATKKNKTNSIFDEESEKNFILSQLKDRISNLCQDYEFSRDNPEKTNSKLTVSEEKVKTPMKANLSKNQAYREKRVKQKTFKEKIQKNGKMMELIKEEKKMKEDDFKNLLKKTAQELKTYPCELGIDIISYDLILKIEKLIQVKKTDLRWNEKLYESLQKVMISYLEANPKERRYKIKKIFHTIIQNFGFKESKKWITYFINKNINNPVLRHYLVQLRIEEVEKPELKLMKKQLWNEFIFHTNLKKNPIFSSQNIQKPQKHEIKEQKRRKKQEAKQNQKSEEELEQQKQEEKNERTERLRELFQKSKREEVKEINEKKEINQKKEINEKQKVPDEPQTSEYPIQFQKRIAKKLDWLIQKRLRETITQKADQICISENVLKKIYEDLGEFEINKKNKIKKSDPQVQPDPQVKSDFSLKIENAKQKMEVVEELELKLVSYMKKFPELTKKEIFVEARYLMKELKVNVVWLNSDEDVQFWIERLEKKYRIERKKSVEEVKESVGKKQNFTVKIPCLRNKLN